MRYTFSIPKPFERFAQIEMEITGPFVNGEVELVLPSWRPGRYEMGNFSKNIRQFKPLDSEGNLLEFKKISKDRWLVSGIIGSKIQVHYEYYANQPDAGACFVDHEQLYINPIHCCFFIPGRESEPCEVVLDTPHDWKTATGLKKVDESVFHASDFDNLVDSPFIASSNLQHGSYILDGVQFHIWFNGDCTPDWSQIIPDFEAFSQVQLDMMEQFPCRDFHFLIQMLPYRFYHGVEHLNSTVLALGPGSELMTEGIYKELLGVASHELFHCWNVKSIRPIEMMPYDYTKENYSSSGYVYEGVTTYYGDLFLGRSGFFSLDAMLAEFSVRLQKHMDNPGRTNHSVAASSFDTWLDGYVQGIPGRKVSIYDEGCLIAWLLDFMIRSTTQNQKSLDDVMSVLYHDFALKGSGYSGDDFKAVCESVAERSFDNFFKEIVHTPNTLLIPLSEAVSLAGLEIEVSNTVWPLEQKFGLRISGNKVRSVYPGSPAHGAGLVLDDEIISINGKLAAGNLNQMVETDLSEGDNLVLNVVSFGKVRDLVLHPDRQTYFDSYRIKSVEMITQQQLLFRESWLGRI